MSDILYGIAGTTGFLGLVTAGILGAANTSGQGATLRERILSSPSLSPLLIIHYFLPYGLVVLTLFMDLMSQLPQGVFGIAIGFAAMLANYFAGNNPAVVPNDLCEIPGLKGLASTLAPQSLLFVSIVVSYLAMFVTTSSSNISSSNTTTNTSSLVTVSGSVSSISPSPSARIGASWGLAASVILIQLIGIMTTPGCLTDITMFGSTYPASVRAVLTAIAGLAIGTGTGYGFANTSFTQPSYAISTSATVSPTLPYVPGLLPTGSQPQAKGPGFVREQFQLGAGLGEMPMPPSEQGQMAVDMAKSSGAVTPGDSSDQFVCEAYKNGQLVSSTLS